MREAKWALPKTGRYGPFFAENQFLPADESVLMGLVVRKYHFDVTACAEARRLAQRAERSRISRTLRDKLAGLVGLVGLS